MHTRTFLLMTGFVLALTVGVAHARQHEGHQEGAPSAGLPNSQVAQCAQAQGLVMGTIEAALKRLEEAQLTNSPAALRAAADDVEAALLDVRARLEPCATMAAAVGPQSHSIANVPQAPSAMQEPPAVPSGSTAAPAGAVAPRAPAQAATDPHAGQAPPSRPAARSTAAAPVAPHRHPTGTSGTARPSRPASPAPADPSASHEKTSSPAAVTKPAAPTPPTALGELMCRNHINPKTAPRMLYQGRTYYFCTESERAEFAKDPGKYVTARPQKAPAHAH
jgi:YHS domain-containing protein